MSDRATRSSRYERDCAIHLIHVFFRRTLSTGPTASLSSLPSVCFRCAPVAVLLTAGEQLDATGVKVDSVGTNSGQMRLESAGPLAFARVMGIFRAPSARRHRRRQSAANEQKELRGVGSTLSLLYAIRATCIAARVAPRRRPMPPASPPSGPIRLAAATAVRRTLAHTNLHHNVAQRACESVVGISRTPPAD